MMDFYTAIVFAFLMYFFYRRQRKRLKIVDAKINQLLSELKALKLEQAQERSIIVEKPSLKPSAESIKESERAQKEEAALLAAKASLKTSKSKEDQKDQPETETETEEQKEKSSIRILGSQEGEPTKKSAFRSLYASSETTQQEEPSEQEPQSAANKKISPASWIQRFKEKNPDLEKFIGENLINKIGILILVLGISYFVKFAIDKDWINEPARVGIGFLAGSILMLIAHRLKAKFASFSSVMVAGGISVYYFTIFIAFQEYQLFSQTVAFALMIIITAFSTLVSLSYNRQELAVLALLGGLASPFLISSGEGNYLVFFSYLIVLNIGILAVSYFKKWKLVNLLAFVSSTLMFGIWLTKEIGGEEFVHAHAFSFALIFYVLFSISSVINNIKSKGLFNGIERATIIGNTFLYFGFSYLVLADWQSSFIGLFTLLFAFYNISYASILYRRLGSDKTNIYLLVGIALSFVTLAVPLQFEGNQITLFWAVEAALLLWLARKSKVNSFTLASMLVQLLAIISLSMDWFKYAGDETDYTIIFNPIFITGLVVIATLIFSKIVLNELDTLRTKFFSFPAPIYRSVLASLAIVISYFVGILETSYQAHSYFEGQTPYILGFSYHFIFLSVLVFFSLRTSQKALSRIGLLIGITSTLLLVFSFYSLLEIELINVKFSKGSLISLAFNLHYIALFLSLYILYAFFKHYPQLAKANDKTKRSIEWFTLLILVSLLSQEVIIQGLNIGMAGFYPTEQEITEFALNEPYQIEEFVLDEFWNAKVQIIKSAWPILWGFLAFIFLLAGIKKQSKNLRIGALALLGLTIVKLFIYDIKDVSETGKIVAFILLGVLILVISFVYQKIKKLVIDEEK